MRQRATYQYCYTASQHHRLITGDQQFSGQNVAIHTYVTR